jgi:ADP-heptose:LPS heptosyltransferase
MNKKGYECINLNNRSLSLLEICNILAMSKAFIGIDSGISHIAHSVGVPSCLYFYNKLATSHPNKKYWTVYLRYNPNLKEGENETKEMM